MQADDALTSFMTTNKRILSRPSAVQATIADKIDETANWAKHNSKGSGA